MSARSSVLLQRAAQDLNSFMPSFLDGPWTQPYFTQACQVRIRTVLYRVISLFVRCLKPCEQFIQNTNPKMCAMRCLAK